MTTNFRDVLTHPGWQKATDATVILTSRAPALRVRARLVEDPPALDGGYGGWAEVERPRDVAYVEWRGTGAQRLRLPLVLDGYGVLRDGTGDRDEENMVRNLEAMARPVAPDEPGGRPGQPPFVRVTGAVPAHASRVWVIESLEWGANVIRDRDAGRRVRQDVVVTLLEWVPVDLALTRAQATGPRVIVARKGDTLAKIAARTLGAAKHWGRVRALNPAFARQGPQARVREGTRVRVPRS